MPVKRANPRQRTMFPWRRIVFAIYVIFLEILMQKSAIKWWS